MSEIAHTFHASGGFQNSIFDGVSEVYRLVAEDTELGKEKTEERKAGTTVGDVARLMSEGVERKLKVE